VPVYLWGSVGAVAPEIVRWLRIARSHTPGEWKRRSYWLATTAYLALGAALAYLIAKPEAGAAFAIGLAGEFIVLGGLATSKRAGGAEEISSAPADPLRVALVTLRRHASFLMPNG
jgi:predicted Rdx family selenoprotein